MFLLSLSLYIYIIPHLEQMSTLFLFFLTFFASVSFFTLSLGTYLLYHRTPHLSTPFFNILFVNFFTKSGQRLPVGHRSVRPDNACRRAKTPALQIQGNVNFFTSVALLIKNFSKRLDFQKTRLGEPWSPRRIAHLYYITLRRTCQGIFQKIFYFLFSFPLFYIIIISHFWILSTPFLVFLRKLTLLRPSSLPRFVKYLCPTQIIVRSGSYQFKGLTQFERTIPRLWGCLPVRRVGYTTLTRKRFPSLHFYFNTFW